MRLDVFLKKVLLVKKRSEAKIMCDNSLISMNNKEAKPSKQVNPGDIIIIESLKGVKQYRVIMLPHGNVRKTQISDYFVEIT